MTQLNEAYSRIRKAGQSNVRVTPMPGQNINDGMHQIEIMEGNQWQTVVSGIPRSTAYDLVTKATNRVICG